MVNLHNFQVMVELLYAILTVLLNMFEHIVKLQIVWLPSIWYQRNNDLHLILKVSNDALNQV